MRQAIQTIHISKGPNPKEKSRQNFSCFSSSRRKKKEKSVSSKKRKAYDGQFKREAVELWKINRN